MNRKFIGEQESSKMNATAKRGTEEAENDRRRTEKTNDRRRNENEGTKEQRRREE